MNDLQEKILSNENLISFWNFNEEGGTRKDLGKYAYDLIEATGHIGSEKSGVFGDRCAKLNEGDWFYIPRTQCDKLNIHGHDASITVVSWIKRMKKSKEECETIAGMWNEHNMDRQYCLFLNLMIHDSNDQVCGHVSSIGGPTPGNRWCMDASIGETPVPFDEWRCVAFTYDGEYVKSYIDGKLDVREKLNPYYYPQGIHNGGKDGSDFTVGGVFRLGEMGNWFVGCIGGLAVFDKALTEAELHAVCI